MGLFGHDDSAVGEGAPLADRMRPRDLDEIVGQSRLLAPGSPLRRAIEEDDLHSIILWGPPGCGKTTLARIVAGKTRSSFVPFSAVLSGIKEVREVMEQAKRRHQATRKRTVIFVDEIHRFNKAQQDAFLPYVEQGTIVLIGATTENPSFEVIAALLSRARVYRLERLSEEDLVALLERALRDAERGLGKIAADVPRDLLATLASVSQGDARGALNVLEIAVATARPDAAGVRHVDRSILEAALQDRALYYDRAGDAHFDHISALHKSMRNSDPDATLYWLARMLEAGEDPLYIARRVVRFASEDVGLADPLALTVAVAAKEAVHFLGRPEGDLSLAQAAVYCALAPKSNALYAGYGEAQAEIRSGSDDPVPLSIRNAVTGLMAREGYGRDYRYAHDFEDAVTDLECLPERLRGRRFYRPTTRGAEKEASERLEAWRKAREK